MAETTQTTPASGIEDRNTGASATGSSPSVSASVPAGDSVEEGNVATGPPPANTTPEEAPTAATDGLLTAAGVNLRLKAIARREYNEQEGTTLTQVLGHLSELLHQLRSSSAGSTGPSAQELAQEWETTLGEQDHYQLSSLAQLQPHMYSQLGLTSAVSSSLCAIVDAWKIHEQEIKAAKEAAKERADTDAAARRAEEDAAARRAEDVAAHATAKEKSKAKEKADADWRTNENKPPIDPNPNLEEFRKVHTTIPMKNIKEALVRAAVADAVFQNKSEEEIKQIEEDEKKSVKSIKDSELRQALRDIKGGLTDTELEEIMPDDLTDEQCRTRTTRRLLMASAIDYTKWDEKPTDALRRIRNILRDCTKEDMKDALRAPSMDRHRFYWFSHVISVDSIDQEKCLIDLRGHFKFFWRVPTAVWDAKMKDGSIKFTTWKDHEQTTCDENGGKNWFQIEDSGKEHGNIFPINPTKPFESSVKIETDNGWWSIKKKTEPDFPGEPAMSLIIMQLDSTITVKHFFDAARYPYDKQAIMLRHLEKKFPHKEFNKTVKKAAGGIELKPLTTGKWHSFSSSPSKISGYRDNKDNWDQLYFPFPGYCSKKDGMEWHTATQLSVQDQPVPSASMADLSQLETQIYPNSIPGPALRSKKEKRLRKCLSFLSKCLPFSVPSKSMKEHTHSHKPFICIRLQRNPTHFFYQVVVPMWIIVNASFTSLVVDEMKDEEPANFADKVQISLTSLLTIIGMYQVVNEMRPHYDGLTRADLFMLAGTAINGLVVFENLMVSYRQEEFDADINEAFFYGMRFYQYLTFLIWNIMCMVIIFDKIWATLSDVIDNGIANRAPKDSNSYTPSPFIMRWVARTWDLAIQRQLRILHSAETKTPSTTLEYDETDGNSWLFTGDQLGVDVAEDGYPMVHTKRKKRTGLIHGISSGISRAVIGRGGSRERARVPPAVPARQPI